MMAGQTFSVLNSPRPLKILPWQIRSFAGRCGSLEPARPILVSSSTLFLNPHLILFHLSSRLVSFQFIKDRQSTIR
jgi:hypothetical protein